jgi:hypothetical protein
MAIDRTIARKIVAPIAAANKHTLPQVISGVEKGQIIFSPLQSSRPYTIF